MVGSCRHHNPFGQISFRMATCAGIALLLYGRAGMDPVIMLPGLGSASSVWGRTIAELGPDYECRVGDTLSDASLTSMAERVLDDAPDRFALAGVSMGGMIAMTIMRLAPERVTRLALFDTNARADTPEQAARRRSTNGAMLAVTDFRALAGPGITYMVHPQTGQDVRDAALLQN